ncbi:Holliday junction branch migration protein RuvA [Teredinibacter sp. KSP-S5-2]|uniref:Holliday junction branch migration protein RuvA n=1 Tax=Teredinibacter sp. KSP-S5-2 TaxID=3034506 RepID=UPI002934E92B|nr:Holliday junction branch migration protein RuvA [Teredinibacter sp. KSP-S5-2]WNO08116.1 Holliday junction branch migration protein RuvA [Teredinibacter sp. KSP-S5-2]
MIGFLSGTLIEKLAPWLLVDVNGVGYEVQSPMTTFFQLPAAGESVTLYTHFSVSENAQQLFGFINKKDRELFRLLIKINGVGPKMAVGIMSMETTDFVRCVMQDNVSALVKVPGVGKKTAERLIIEMRDKLKGWGEAAEPAQAGIINIEHNNPLDPNTLIADAEAALVALGYKPTDAAKVVASSYTSDVQTSEELIRLALRSMLPA